MSIKYAVRPCPNPNGIEGTDYFAPRAVKYEDYTMEEMVRDINDATGMSEIDVRGVLYAIHKQIYKQLLNGHTVVLEGIGRISVSLDTKCFSQDAMAASDFNPASFIKGVRVRFRPDAKIMKALRANKSLQKVSSEFYE